MTRFRNPFTRYHHHRHGYLYVEDLNVCKNCGHALVRETENGPWIHLKREGYNDWVLTNECPPAIAKPIYPEEASE